MKQNKKGVLFIFISLFLICGIIYYIFIPLDVPEIELKSYLGYEYTKLNKKQISIINKDIKKINDIKINRFNYKNYENELKKLNHKLKHMNINLPYSDYSEYIKDNKTIFSNNDYKKIMEINDKINSLNLEIQKIQTSRKMNKLNSDAEKIDSLKKKRGQILLKYNLDPYQISNEIDNSQKIITSIPIKNCYPIYPDNINNTDRLLYNNLWNEIKLIIPNKYLKYISNMNIFTDGSQNTLAYVMKNEQNNNWSISVDLIDSIDYKGNFTTDFTDTLIHEFMHLITLNISQLNDKIYEFGEAYTLDEGSLKKNSYLNQFYNKFWKHYNSEIYLQNNQDYPSEYKDYLNSEFYNKHKNEFVTEYATTSPEEDIAETFMEFVTNNKPASNDIKDEKIKFLYNYTELIELRNYIRKNLNIK